VYLFELLRRVAKKGHRVSMVTSQYPGLPEREVVDGISVIRVEANSRLVRMLKNYQVYMHFFAGRTDVIFEEVEGPQGPFFLKTFVKEPIVLVWYQLGRKIFLGQFGRVLGRILYLLDHVYSGLYPRELVVSLSTQRKAELSRLGRHRKILVVQPGTPDFKRIPLSLRGEGPQRGCDPPYLLTVNKIRKYKALDHVIRAFGQIAGEFPTLKVVVGGTRDDERYEMELVDLGNRLAPGRVSVFANLSPFEKERLMKGAYAFVLPSPVEGFSLATLEALALGTPAIVSDGVPEELVVDSFNGLRYPFGDLDKLADKARLLLSDPDLRARLSSAGLRTAEKFSWDSSTQELLSSLEDYLSEAKGPGGREFD
jgi:glycosyltransferase involved in cell wall biosynthesis